MAFEKKFDDWKHRVGEGGAIPTMDDDSRWVPEDARDTGFIHWLTLVNARGDDGKRYFIELVPMTGIEEAGVDIWMMEICSEVGSVEQIPNSIYKVAKYPFQQAERYTFWM